MRICIVTPSPPGLSETFIRAHHERLPHEMIHLHGTIHDYTHGDKNLRDVYEWKNGSDEAKWLNILPRFIEFRLRRRYFPSPSDIDLTTAFLREKKIDVVLAEYGTTAAQIMPACQRAKVPLVVHFHGFDASRYDTLQIYADSYREMFQYASTVISVSEAMSLALVRLGCPREKIEKNPYGPLPDFFEIKPDYHSNILLAVGRHTAKKAPYLTLDAFRRAHEIRPELRLRFIGTGELMEVSQRLVAAWGLQDCVELMGAADPECVVESMTNAFAFVQHSVRANNGDAEGTPVAILEASAAGLPVISTAHAGIPEVVVHGETGFIVEPGDVQGMTNRIVELACNRDLVQSLGQSARSRTREYFAMERHIAQLDNILRFAAENESQF